MALTRQLSTRRITRDCPHVSRSIKVSPLPLCQVKVLSQTPIITMKIQAQYGTRALGEQDLEGEKQREEINISFKTEGC